MRHNQVVYPTQFVTEIQGPRWLSGLLPQWQNGTQLIVEPGSACAANSQSAFPMILDAGGALDTAVFGPGGMDVDAAPTADTWYRLYLIARPDGRCNVIASTQSPAPIMPAGWTYFRRIASFRTDALGGILPMRWIGDHLDRRHTWIAPAPSVAAPVTLSTTAQFTLDIGNAISTFARRFACIAQIRGVDTTEGGICFVTGLPGTFPAAPGFPILSIPQETDSTTNGTRTWTPYECEIDPSEHLLGFAGSLYGGGASNAVVGVIPLGFVEYL